MSSIRLLVDDGITKKYECMFCKSDVVLESGKFYMTCKRCGANYITYRPARHQREFHKSKHCFRLNIGGYGSGKTTMDAFEVIYYAITHPNTTIAIVAITLGQAEGTIIKELENMLPSSMYHKVKKPILTYTLRNGSVIKLLASNDEQNLRSLNLSGFLMVEGSGIDFSIFNQLTTRIRNSASKRLDKNGNVIYDMFGIVETNPEFGWIRDEFLLRSDYIYTSPNVMRADLDKLRKDRLPEYASFMTSTVDNEYLPPNYVRVLTMGKTQEWIYKYVYCKLDATENAIYPMFLDNVIEPFEIPKSWKRMYGFDKGWSANTALICGAIDPKTGVLYIYDEYAEKRKPLVYHGAQVKERVIGYKLYKNIQADPTVRNKSDISGVSYKDYFFNVTGIVLDLANNDIKNGIERVRNFLYTKRIFIFSNCTGLINEATNYVYKDKDKEIPRDGNDDRLDAFKYLVSGLPNDIEDMKESYDFTSHTNPFYDDNDSPIITDNFVNTGVYVGGIPNYDNWRE